MQPITATPTAAIVYMGTSLDTARLRTQPASNHRDRWSWTDTTKTQLFCCWTLSHAIYVYRRSQVEPSIMMRSTNKRILRSLKCLCSLFAIVEDLLPKITLSQPRPIKVHIFRTGSLVSTEKIRAPPTRHWRVITQGYISRMSRSLTHMAHLGGIYPAHSRLSHITSLVTEDPIEPVSSEHFSLYGSAGLRYLVQNIRPRVVAMLSSRRA